MPGKLDENRIILADGSIVMASYCGYSDRDLWCMTTGLSMMECMQIFSNPQKTQVIESYYFGLGYRYTGFTELLLVQKSEQGVDIRLTWPEGAPHSIEKIEPVKEEPEQSEEPDDKAGDE
jgi:hypothetical protein